MITSSLRSFGNSNLQFTTKCLCNKRNRLHPCLRVYCPTWSLLATCMCGHMVTYPAQITFWRPAFIDFSYTVCFLGLKLHQYFLIGTDSINIITWRVYFKVTNFIWSLAKCFRIVTDFPKPSCCSIAAVLTCIWATNSFSKQCKIQTSSSCHHPEDGAEPVEVSAGTAQYRSQLCGSRSQTPQPSRQRWLRRRAGCWRRWRSGGGGGGQWGTRLRCVWAWGWEQRRSKSSDATTVLNAQSVVGNIDELSCVAAELQPDLILITESWCNSNVTTAY